MKRLLFVGALTLSSLYGADTKWVRVPGLPPVIVMPNQGCTEPMDIPKSPRSTTPPLLRPKTPPFPRSSKMPPPLKKKRRNRFDYASGDLSGAIAAFQVAKKKIETIHDEAVRAEAGRDTVGKDVLYSA